MPDSTRPSYLLSILRVIASKVGRLPWWVSCMRRGWWLILNCRDWPGEKCYLGINLKLHMDNSSISKLHSKITHLSSNHPISTYKYHMLNAGRNSSIKFYYLYHTTQSSLLYSCFGSASPLYYKDVESTKEEGIDRTERNTNYRCIDFAIRWPAILHNCPMAQPSLVFILINSSFLSALFIWSYLFGLYVLWTSFMLRILHD